MTRSITSPPKPFSSFIRERQKKASATNLSFCASPYPTRNYYKKQIRSSRSSADMPRPALDPKCSRACDAKEAWVWKKRFRSEFYYPFFDYIIS